MLLHAQLYEAPTAVLRSAHGAATAAQGTAEKEADGPLSSSGLSRIPEAGATGVGRSYKLPARGTLTFLGNLRTEK